MNKLVLYGVLVGLLFSACKKEKVSTTDYRDKYVGTYECEIEVLDDCYEQVDENELTVIVNKADQDSSIQVLDATLKLDKEGSFGRGLYPDPNYHGFGGSFYSKDSITFITQTGGTGCFTRIKYLGKRK